MIVKVLQRLRNIALECGREEKLKWKVPCYTFQGRNIDFKAKDELVIPDEVQKKFGRATSVAFSMGTTDSWTPAWLCSLLFSRRPRDA